MTDAVGTPAAPLAPPDWIIAAEAKGWRWARIMWDRAAAQPESWFDDKKAQAVVDLWPTVVRHTEDRFLGYPFRLSEVQEVIVRLLFGWKIPADVTDPATGAPVRLWVRLYKELRLWVPRKWGKSEFLAGLGLIVWLIEGVPAGQGFIFGRDEAQGRIIFDKMATMISLEERFSNGVVVIQHKNMWCPALRSPMRLMSGKPEGKHGRSATIILGTEMHEWTTRDLQTTLRQSTGARLQPLEAYDSTAGLKSNRVGFGMFEESKQILEGAIDDASVLVVMFALDDDDDWTDEANIARVNPNIGVTPTWSYIRRELAAAKQSTTAEMAFRRYHCNQWVDSATRWLRMDEWDACAKSDWRTAWERNRHRRCALGFDVSSTKDLTALVAWFEPDTPGGRHELAFKFYIPEENVETRVKRDRVPYDKWLKMGALIATPGNYIDQAYLQADIEDAVANHDVSVIGWDKFNATKLFTDLQANGVDPDKFVVVRQGIPTLGEPTKDVERLVGRGLLDHGAHPVMRWMAGNTVVHFDRNMNFAPAKDRSREKIDGMSATVTARAAMLVDVSEPSEWENPDYSPAIV